LTKIDARYGSYEVGDTTYAALFAEIGTVATGLGDGTSRSVMGNTNASLNLAYIDTNNSVPLIENTGGGAAHNNMPPYLSANLFIYAGV